MSYVSEKFLRDNVIPPFLLLAVVVSHSVQCLYVVWTTL